MQYFKYSYSELEWQNFFTRAINDFTSMGFYDKTGKEIKKQDDKYITLKWKYDKKNPFYCNLFMGEGLTYGEGNDFHPTYSNGQNGPNFMSRGSVGDYNTLNPDPRFIFIPLKNYGFYLNGRNHNTFSSLYTKNWVYSNVDINFDFINEYSETNTDARDGFDLIALPTKKPNEFYYLYSNPGYDFLNTLSPYQYSSYKAIIDMNYGNIKTLSQTSSLDYDYYPHLYHTDFILPTPFGKNPNTYINPHKEDTCTLGHIYTKDTQERIDNLYMLIDKPQQIDTRSIFTIGDRTFFCFTNPFVIELPNN